MLAEHLNDETELLAELRCYRNSERVGGTSNSRGVLCNPKI